MSRHSSLLNLTKFACLALLVGTLSRGSASGQTVRQNFALRSNGASATASSELSAGCSNWPVRGIIDGDRKGSFWGNNGGWADQNSSDFFNDYVVIDFGGSKTIDEIDVFTVQDNYTSPSEPTATMTFTTYGLTAYTVQYLQGSTWTTIASVSGNNYVWKKFTFPAVTTSSIKVITQAAADNGYSRLTEVEAWGSENPPAKTNVALRSNGAIAEAYSELTLSCSTWPARGTIDGDRKGAYWANTGGWASSSGNFTNEYLEIRFSGTKTIDEIDVFTVQDNYAIPIEPTLDTTFTLYGLTAYDISYWNGTAWIQIPETVVTGNNKIWKQLTFNSITTSKIRVYPRAAIDNGYSRIAEVEVWSTNQTTCASRVDALNQTGGGGENPLSRNFNWTLPLVNLPGRAGLDLNIGLSYNSLVWTKSCANSITFDDDRGWPAPGFRLGFPVIQPLYYNEEVGKYAYLLIGPDGSRTELRQVSTTGPNNKYYESADSSHLLLDNSTMILRTTDGTQLSFATQGNDFQCTQVKDRNGNYVTINYTPFGRIDTVIDTLNRSIKFNYDGNGSLTSITQTWGVNETHIWASFEYTTKTIQTNFTGLTVGGPASIKALTKVTLDDGSRFNFDYTVWGQVWKVSNFAADNHLLNYRSYNVPGWDNPPTPSAQTDCPRFTERRDWAENWNRGGSPGSSGLPAGAEQEVVTTFAVPVSDAWTMPDNSSQSGMRAQVTMPDGTSNKIYFIGTAGTPSGWRRALPALVNTYDSSATLQRQIMTTWTQDNAVVSYQLNPRVEETNVYDAPPSTNRKRTRIGYQTISFTDGTSCQLPRDVFEYDANASTVLRSTRTDYNTDTDYTSRRIIGLVSQKRLYAGDVTAGGTLTSQLEFLYDGSGSIQGNDAAVQHDNTNYAANFVTGRANLSSVKRYDVTSTLAPTTTTIKYNVSGSIVSTKDPNPENHTTTITYIDEFSDGISRNTFAYPTTVTDADGYSSRTKYNFDFGRPTWRQTPLPNATEANETTNTTGPQQTITYDSFARVQQVTNLANNSYTRFVYPTSRNRVDTYVAIQEISGQIQEAHSFQITDGLGRVFASASDHPGSEGGFAGQLTLFDVMGQPIKTSNPTETAANGLPVTWTAVGADAPVGWIYTQQSYDWKGRPLITINPSHTSGPGDTTTKVASYDGCGCAGGQVVTLTDEGTGIAPNIKKRQQKIYSDVLGRVWKTEVLNWDGSAPDGTGPNNTVYSTTVSTFNVRDQVTLVRWYQGSDSSSVFQEAVTTYDGFGRVKTQRRPEQQIDPNNSASTDHTTFNYNGDDTLQSIVDARGVITTFTHNGRHFPNGIAFDKSAVPSSVNLPPTASVAFSYDAVGNRKSMTDGSGTVDYHYDSLSRIDWEEKTFSTPPASGTYRLNYEYTLAGILKKVTDQRSGTSFTQSFDQMGRVTGVDGVGFNGAQTQFTSQMKYRAWGGIRSLSQGNGLNVDFAYNRRLLLTSFTFGTFGGTYQYHNDGQPKFVDVLTTDWYGIKDRAYSYDAAGRMKEAYSGLEARNYKDDATGGTPDGPYRRTYSYDAWNNMISDSGRYWNREVNTLSSFNSNNRNPDWTYNADGRLITRNESIDPGTYNPFQPLKYTFDASGNQVTATQTRTYYQPTAGGMVSTLSTNTQIFDGDGQLTNYSLNRLISLNGSQVDNVTEQTFFVRSTVMGGVAISEYDASGWRVTHVYAGGERIGQQGKGEAGGPVSSWRNVDPVTGDALITYPGGSGGNSTLDPQGVDVGEEDPFPTDGSGDLDGIVAGEGSPESKGVSLPLAVEGGRAKCVVDGISMDCGFVGIEKSVQCPNNDCGPRRVAYQGERVWAFFQLFGDGYFGYVPTNARYVGNGGIAPRGSGGAPRLGRIGGRPNTKGDTDLGRLNGARGPEEDLAYNYSIVAGTRSQNTSTITVPLDVKRLERLMNDTLKYGDCAEYIARLINKAAEQTGKPPEDTNIMVLFEKIKSQPKGGILFDRNDIPGHPEIQQVPGGGGWAWGWYSQGNAMINIYRMGYYRDNPSGAKRVPYAYGERGVHEVIHLSAKGGLGYVEEELTRAARALEPNGTFVDWDGFLKSHCMPPQFR